MSRGPGSGGWVGAAEPQWGGKGQQGKYFLGMCCPANFSRVSPPSQPTSSAHHPTRTWRLQQVNPATPTALSVGECSAPGAGPATARAWAGRCGSPRVPAGGAPGPPWGRGFRGPGRRGEGPSVAEVGGVREGCPRGGRASALRRSRGCSAEPARVAADSFPGRRDARRRWRRAPGLGALGRRAVPAER